MLFCNLIYEYYSLFKYNQMCYTHFINGKEEKNMFYVSEIMTVPPESYKTELQEKVYAALDKLGIGYERVDTDEAITMEDCVAINEKLNMKMVKTLFLCNRQQTEFYLFITAGDKPFRSKDFSAALGISRVSFAPPELMQEKLGTKIGAATVFSALLETASGVNIIFDKDILKEDYYGCSDGTTTGYMKIKTSDITGPFIRSTGHNAEFIDV